MVELQKRSAVRLRILRFTPCFQITLPGVEQAEAAEHGSMARFGIYGMNDGEFW